MAPLSVDPAALDGAGVTLTDVGKDIGWTMSTLAGTLSGCGGMCGDDPVGSAIGESYDSAAAGLLKAFAASRNGLVNLGDGVRMSAHNYSMAEALSDGRGAAEPLPVPAASGSIASGQPPTSVGGSIPAPPGFGWVSKYIGMIWPTADSAQLRTAAGAWMAAGTELLVTQTTAAPALGVIGAQQIPEAEAMGKAFADSLNAASEVMSHTTSVAAKLISYADKVDEVHAAIIDLLARICDPMTGAKIIWDFLTDDEESEIKQIAEDIKTVVDNFASQVSALMAELKPMVGAAATIAESMLKLADKEWEQFLQGNPVGQIIDDMAQVSKGFGLQAWELVEGAWTYSPQRAVVDPQGSLDSYRQLVSGMAPLVGADEDGWAGTGDAWLQVGKETVHWDLWKTNPAEALGRSAFDVATFFLPGGGASKLGTLGHGAAETAEAVSRVAPHLELPKTPVIPKVPELPKGPDVPVGGSPTPASVPDPPKTPTGGAPVPPPEQFKVPEPESGAPVSASVPPQTHLGPTEHKPLPARPISDADVAGGSAVSAPSQASSEGLSAPPGAGGGGIGSGGGASSPGQSSPFGGGSPTGGGAPLDHGPGQQGNGRYAGPGASGGSGDSSHATFGGASGAGAGGHPPDGSPSGGHGSPGDGANNPPHTGLTDPPANRAPEDAVFPDLTDINNEFRLPGGPVDPARFDEWATKVSDAYPALSKEGVEGIYRYTTQDYDAFNAYLRDVDPLSDSQKYSLGARSIDDMTPEQRSALEAQIQKTDDGLASLPPYRADPSDASSITWRGLRAPDELLSKFEVGKTFTDGAFFSSSKDQFVAESFARGAGPNETPLLLKVEGHNGVDVTQLSKYADESEVLFPRSSSFEVISAQLDENGVMRVILRQKE
ncbi:hypothetical protein BVC93_02160 [Mycobacterium sp. MS1601]|uniref:ADP-ribosyltransferase n=1 Tax=Mycobacterium sp. MS1601 TaxID=1936029 RepID=UPI0009794F73|nr:ADP-ribosyltransferase [Mycobacterium sp. MS1601]AQA01432.1 hypothetical protein BVC93_02160 [Mycobacterium sp. MS1601]